MTNITNRLANKGITAYGEHIFTIDVSDKLDELKPIHDNRELVLEFVYDLIADENCYEANKLFFGYGIDWHDVHYYDGDTTVEILTDNELKGRWN